MKWKIATARSEYRQLVALAFIVCLPSCSPEKQFAKFLAKHPEFAKNDTIRIHDTIITKEVVFDTAVVLYMHDTIELQKDRWHTRIVRMPGDTFYVDGGCLPDTIVRDTTITVLKLIPCPEGYRVAYWWKSAAIGSAIVAGLLLLFFALFARRQVKEK